VLTLAAAVVPAASHAQRELEPRADDAEQQRLVAAIQEIQSREGPFSPELIDPFTELALLYETGGDRALAAAAIDRTLQLLRVNEGLFTLEQIPLLEQAIQTEEAGGNRLDVGDREKQIQKVIAKHPNDERIVPVLHNLGDRQMAEVRRLQAGELPPPVCFGTNVWSDGSTLNGGCPSRSDREAMMVGQAVRYYVGAIDVLLRQKAYTNAELPDIEMELVRISYFHTGAYAAAHRSLLRQVSYAVARQEPLVDRVAALVRVADWDLLHDNNGQAFKAYEEAHAFLMRQDLPPAAIDEIFAPAVPVMLPDFVANPLDTGAAGATGYIDVSFAIHRFGNVRDFTILGATANATRDDKKALESLVRRHTFRPRAVGGAMASEAPVRFRYYLHARPASGATESSY
jgi:hypothetical protein